MKAYLTIVNDDGSEMVVEEPFSEYGFSYADYLTWNFKERIELIRGQIFKMSPAPALIHQRISLNILKLFTRFFETKPCHFFHAPVDVKLKGKGNNKKKFRDEDIITVVQPDIIIVCDDEKLKDGRAVDGAPDLIVEILSPGSTKMEMKYKLELYEENAVKEYWIVYPEYKQLAVFVLSNDLLYDKPVYYTEKTVVSSLFPDLNAALTEIFTIK